MRYLYAKPGISRGALLWFIVVLAVWVVVIVGIKRAVSMTIYHPMVTNCRTYEAMKAVQHAEYLVAVSVTSLKYRPTPADTVRSSAGTAKSECPAPLN